MPPTPAGEQRVARSSSGRGVVIVAGSNLGEGGKDRDKGMEM
jgi:hypothetical protein